jgi:hypothetical protein
MAGAATQNVRNVVASRVFLRRSNPQLVNRRLLDGARSDKIDVITSVARRSLPMLKGFLHQQELAGLGRKWPLGAGRSGV